jgi:hypothetical protein
MWNSFGPEDDDMTRPDRRDVFGDSTDRGFGNHVQETAGAERFVVGKVRNEPLPRFVEPLRVQVDLIANVGRDLAPLLLGIAGYDQPEV